MKFLPSIAGLLGCFLGEATYTIAGNETTTRIAENYSGWSIVIILLLHAVVVLIFSLKSAKIPGGVFWVPGLYITGFCLIRLFNILTLFKGATPGSLIQTTESSAQPGLGLILVLLSGIWLVASGISKSIPKFSTLVE